MHASRAGAQPLAEEFARVSDYLALIEKRDLQSLSIMKTGRSLALDLLAEDPSFYDAYLAVQKKAALTEREQMFIEANLSPNGYHDLIEKFPDDLEAKAREVWRIWYRLRFAPAYRTHGLPFRDTQDSGTPWCHRSRAAIV